VDSMEKRFLIIIIVGVVVVLAVSGGILAFALSGGDEKTAPDVPGMETFMEETMILTIPDDGAMIDDGSTMYFPITPNGTDVVMISNVNAGIGWSDDEVPPSWRLTYQNEPDTMEMSIVMLSESGEANDTQIATGSSDTGTVNLIFNMAQNNGIVRGNGGANWSIPETGDPEVTGNATFYISVGCTAGPIRSTRPAMLMYNDFGDEIGMTVTISYKQIPLEVYEYWQKEAAAEAAEPAW